MREFLAYGEPVTWRFTLGVLGILIIIMIVGGIARWLKSKIG